MFKKILTYLPSMVVPIVINLIIMILSGRWLSPAEYGIYSIYSTTITLLYSFGLAFIQNSALRFYTDERYKDFKVFFTTYVLADLAGGVLLTGVAAIIHLFIPALNTWLVAASVLANGLYMLCVNIDRLQDRHVQYTAARCLASVLNISAFVVMALVLHYTTSASPVISMYGAYLAIALVKLARHFNKFDVSCFSRELFVDTLKFGLPLIGVSVVGSLVAHSDQYMLLYFLDETAVGLYSLGYKIADYSVTRFTTLLLVVATPAIIRYYDEKKIKKSQDTIIATVDMITWIWFALMSFCLMYADELVRFVFPKYDGAQPILQVVIVAALFHCISELYCKPFELAKKTKRLLMISIVSGAVNIGYNLIFIPIQGTIAAAISSVLAYLALDLILYFDGRKYMDVTPSLKLSLKMFATAAITCAVAYGLKKVMGCGTLLLFGVQVLICGVVYIGFSFVTGQIKQVFLRDRKKKGSNQSAAEEA